MTIAMIAIVMGITTIIMDTTTGMNMDTAMSTHIMVRDWPECMWQA